MKIKELKDILNTLLATVAETGTVDTIQLHNKFPKLF